MEPVTPGRRAIWTRRLLRCGMAAGPVFVTAFVAEGGTRDGYRPLRHPVSSLALAPDGWAQSDPGVVKHPVSSG